MKRHRAVVVTDLLFGDSGKGTIVDWATRQLTEAGRETLVVRFSGGAQAAHAVATSDGREHVFQQFGAGSLVANTRTLLDAPVLVNPLLLFWEAERLAALGVAQPLSRVLVHREALLTTPYHVATNRIKERLRGAAAHGSCGLGIGETAADGLAHPTLVPRVADLTVPSALRSRLAWHRALKRAEVAALPGATALPEFAVFDDADETEAFVALAARLSTELTLVGDDFLARHLAQHNAATVFEGSQGVLLDEWRGFHPYTTWSTVTNERAMARLDGTGAEVLSLGVLRGYATRHGAGPFPTEDAALTAALPDPTNPDNPWQGQLRVGWTDLPLLRYGLSVAGRIDALAVTCLDRMVPETDWQVATAYRGGTEPTPGPFRDLDYQAALTETLWAAVPQLCPWAGDGEAHAAALSKYLERPLAVTSWGRTAADKRGSVL